MKQSAHIRSEPLTYEPFLFHPELGLPMTAREFCESFVEAVGKEAGGEWPSSTHLLWTHHSLQIMFK